MDWHNWYWKRGLIRRSWWTWIIMNKVGFRWTEWSIWWRCHWNPAREYASEAHSKLLEWSRCWAINKMTWKFRPFLTINISVQIIFIIWWKNREKFSRHYDRNDVNIGQTTATPKSRYSRHFFPEEWMCWILQYQLTQVNFKFQNLFHYFHNSSYTQTFPCLADKFQKFSFAWITSLYPTFLWNILFSFQFLSTYHFRSLLFPNLNDDDFFLDPAHQEASDSLCPKYNLIRASKIFLVEYPMEIWTDPTSWIQTRLVSRLDDSLSPHLIHRQGILVW